MSHDRTHLEGWQAPVAALGFVALGAAIMYGLDPVGGRRRRAFVRDKVVRFGHVTRHGVAAAATRTGNRLRGVVATIRRHGSDEPVDDGILIERARAALGHAVADASLIELTALGGRLTLRGLVPAAELKPLLSRLAQVSGVLEIDDQLDVVEEAGVAGAAGEDDAGHGLLPMVAASLAAALVGAIALLAAKRHFRDDSLAARVRRQAHRLRPLERGLRVRARAARDLARAS